MPELPEVHALAADLDARLRGRVVERLEVLAFAALKTFDPPVSALHGREVRGVSRHGKFLDLGLGPVRARDAPGSSSAKVPPWPSPGAAPAELLSDGLHVIIHLARTGWVRWRDSAPQSSGRPGRSPLSARLVLDDGTRLVKGSGFDITEAGSKKSLAIHVVRAPDDVPGIARLGPDPLDPAFSFERFRRILESAGRKQLKGLLRDQSVIAGIGNAYSDEILHEARMSPFAPAAMSLEDAERLFEALRTTLGAAVGRAEGLAASELKREKKSGLRVHGRTGLPCPVCGDTVRQVIYSDSTFQYCPGCQTRGKPLADRVLSRLLK